MGRNLPRQDMLPQASLSAVFLLALHMAIQLFRIFVTTFMDDRSIIGAEEYDRLLRDFFFLTIFSLVWTFAQALPAIWAKKIDTTVVIYISLLVCSTATMLYMWMFWHSARISFSHAYIPKVWHVISSFHFAHAMKRDSPHTDLHKHLTLMTSSIQS
jgi:hypothetical protein